MNPKGDFTFISKLKKFGGQESKDRIHRLVISLLTVGSITAATQNCSNGSSSFSEAPASAEAEELHSFYKEISNNKAFQSTYNFLLDNRKALKLSDEVTIDGKKVTNLNSKLKAYMASSPSLPKASLREFINSDPTIGEISARDFDLAKQIRNDVIFGLGDQTRLFTNLRKYSKVDALRSLRANVVLAAVGLSTQKKQYNNTKGKAGLKLDGEDSGEHDDPKPGVISQIGDATDKASGGLAKLENATANAAGTLMNASGGLVSSVTHSITDGYDAITNTATTAECNKMLESCTEAVKSSDKLGTNNAAELDKINKELDICERRKPEKNCNYGQARNGESELLGGSDKHAPSCSKYKIFYCVCDDAKKKTQEGTYLHDDDKECPGYPKSDYKVSFTAITNIKKEAQEALAKAHAGTEGAPASCEQWKSLCKGNPATTTTEHTTSTTGDGTSPQPPQS